MQHSKRSFKKIPPIEIITSWQIHWHASSSLTLLINIVNIHAAGQSNWLLLSFLLMYWIAGIGVVIHYKHNLIHLYVQSLNPILKILKFKYLQIRHKPCNQLATKAQSFPRKSSNTASPWQLASPEISHELEGSFENEALEIWVLRFRVLGASFSRFGCPPKKYPSAPPGFVLRSSFSSASFSKLPELEGAVEIPHP